MSEELKRAQKELDDRVMGKDGVEGTAIGQRGGEACLLVYVSSKEGASRVPGSVRGVPVFAERTGGFQRRDGR